MNATDILKKLTCTRPAPARAWWPAVVAALALATGCRRAGPWFVDRSAALGEPFVFESGAEGGFHLPEINGGGVGLVDYDGDADLDVLLLNGGRLSNGLPVTGDDGARGRLYRNDGAWRFADVTAVAGLGDTGYNLGLAAGDVDNDGDVDLYFANHGPNRLFLNQGDGTFREVTKAAGIAVEGWCASAAFVDVDRDDDLDLYVARYGVYDPEMRCTDGIGRPNYCGPQNYRYMTDVLLRNDGGRFTDVSKAAGIAASAFPALGVVCDDFDGDGWVDIFVANDGTANVLWHNQGDGTFRDIAVEVGAAFSGQGVPRAGMGVTAADFDGDGWPDIFVTNLIGEMNGLFRNLGAGGGFSDVASAVGLGMPSAAHTGFGTVALDIELDGDADLVAANGDVRVLDAPGRPLPADFSGDAVWRNLAQANTVYINEAQSGAFKFEKLDDARCGPLCAERDVSRGLARGDLDDDGDLDLVVGNVEGPARLYENVAPRAGHWLQVRAFDPRLRRDALGARIEVIAAGRRWVQTARAADSYVSTSDPRVQLGLGPVTEIDEVVVRWPDGAEESFAAPCVDCRVTCRRGEGRTATGGTAK